MSIPDNALTVAQKMQKVYEAGIMAVGGATQEYVQEYVDYAVNNIDGVAIGEQIHLSNSTTSNLNGMRVFGKTTQNGEASLNTPQLLIHVGNNGTVEVNISPVAQNETSAERQSISLQTPNGLAGIMLPSSTGKERSNYTDSNGNRWICDEIDFERGVYIKNIQRANVNIGSTAQLSGGLISGIYTVTDKLKMAGVGALCEKSMFRLSGSTLPFSEGYFYENNSNFVFIGTTSDTKDTLKAKYDGCEIIYVLAEPVETPLTNEQIEVYKKFHTYSPTTYVYNSDDAFMEIGYAADRQKYVYDYVDGEIDIASAVSNAAVFVTRNERLYIERNGQDIYIKPNAGIAIYSSVTGTLSYTWDDICNSLKKDGSTYIVTSNMGVENCLDLKYYRALVYDVVASKFKIIGHISQVDESTQISLAFSNYGTIGGKLVEANNQDSYERLNVVEAKIDNVSTNTTNIAKVQEFASLFNNTSNVESFIFFTDPHLATKSASDNWGKEFRNYLNVLKEVDQMAPTSFIVCGGDWLGNSDTQAEACYKLGYIDSYMKSNFNNYHLVVGNHDTNYQGENIITNDTIKNLWYRKTQKAYYRFEGQHSDYYVLDTQLDSGNNLGFDSYLIEQLGWFASELLKNDSPHTAIFMHMYINANNRDGEGVCHPTYSDFSNMIGNVITAFNSRGTIEISGTTYNFGKCEGHTDYAMCGHTHIDYNNETIGGIPCIVTRDMGFSSGVASTFDLCLADYDNNKLYLVRVGSGENRTIDI